MIIDGGRPQIKAILKIFYDNKIIIPLIGIAKTLISNCGNRGLPKFIFKK
jgi:excinuclease UvrABC nuclease subunit